MVLHDLNEACRYAHQLDRHEGRPDLPPGRARPTWSTPRWCARSTAWRPRWSSHPGRDPSGLPLGLAPAHATPSPPTTCSLPPSHRHPGRHARALRRRLARRPHRSRVRAASHRRWIDASSELAGGLSGLLMRRATIWRARRSSSLRRADLPHLREAAERPGDSALTGAHSSPAASPAVAGLAPPRRQKNLLHLSDLRLGRRPRAAIRHRLLERVGRLSGSTADGAQQVRPRCPCTPRALLHGVQAL